MTSGFNADQARTNVENTHFPYEKIINEMLHATEAASKVGRDSATFQYPMKTLGENGVIPIETEFKKRGFNFEASSSLDGEIVTIKVSF